MKRISLILLLSLAVNLAHGQVVNFTPNANTIIIATNTTVGIGAGNFKSYLVCPGAALSYAESSTMDTILLESGAKVKFDSSMSYGYASVYAKSGSTVDMNFRQTGKLTYEAGVTILDTNIGPPSFFFGKSLAAPLNYLYTQLPGGVGCAPNAVIDVQKDYFMNVRVDANQLQLYMNKETAPLMVKIVNSFGQILLKKQIQNEKESVDISALSSGLYYLVWNTGMTQGSNVFVK